MLAIILLAIATIVVAVLAQKNKVPSSFVWIGVIGTAIAVASEVFPTVGMTWAWVAWSVALVVMIFVAYAWALISVAVVALVAVLSVGLPFLFQGGHEQTIASESRSEEADAEAAAEEADAEAAAEEAEAAEEAGTTPERGAEASADDEELTDPEQLVLSALEGSGVRYTLDVDEDWALRSQSSASRYGDPLLNSNDVASWLAAGSTGAKQAEQVLRDTYSTKGINVNKENLYNPDNWVTVQALDSVEWPENFGLVLGQNVNLGSRIDQAGTVGIFYVGPEVAAFAVDGQLDEEYLVGFRGDCANPQAAAPVKPTRKPGHKPKPEPTPMKPIAPQPPKPGKPTPPPTEPPTTPPPTEPPTTPPPTEPPTTPPPTEPPTTPPPTEPPTTPPPTEPPTTPPPTEPPTTPPPTEPPTTPPPTEPPTTKDPDDDRIKDEDINPAPAPSGPPETQEPVEEQPAPPPSDEGGTPGDEVVDLPAPDVDVDPGTGDPEPPRDQETIPDVPEDVPSNEDDTPLEGDQDPDAGFAFIPPLALLGAAGLRRKLEG